MRPHTPSSDRMEHHKEPADVLPLKPSSADVTQAAGTPAIPDVVGPGERLLEHSLILERQVEPLVVIEDDSTMLPDKDQLSSKSVGELSARSSRHSERGSEFPLTWTSIDAMQGVRRSKNTAHGVEIQNVERGRFDGGTKIGLGRSVVESIPPDSGKTTTSRATTSTSRKRLLTRKERTQMREELLDRVLLRSDGQPPQSSVSAADLRPLSERGNAMAWAQMRPSLPTSVRQKQFAVQDGDKSFLDKVPFSSPRSLPPLSPRQRGMADDAVLREININRDRSRLTTPTRGLAGATSSSWNTTPSPDKSASMPTRRQATSRLSAGDDALWDVTHLSTPATPPHDHSNNRPALAEQKSRFNPSALGTGARLQDDVRGVAAVRRATDLDRGDVNLEESVSATLASRSFFVDEVTGYRLVLPPPPVARVGPLYGNRQTQTRVQPSSSLTDQLSADPSIRRTQKRMKFLLAIPKATLDDLQSAGKQPSGITNDSSNPDRHGFNPAATRRHNGGQHRPPIPASNLEMKTEPPEDVPVRPSFNRIDTSTTANHRRSNDQVNARNPTQRLNDSKHPVKKSNLHETRGNLSANTGSKNLEIIEWEKLTGSTQKRTVASSQPPTSQAHTSSGDVQLHPSGTASKTMQKRGISPHVEFRSDTRSLTDRGGVIGGRNRQDGGKAVNAVKPTRISVEDLVPQKPSHDDVTSSLADRRHPAQTPKRRLFSPNSAERHSFRPLVTQQELDQHFKAKRESPMKRMTSVQPPATSKRDEVVKDTTIGRVAELRSVFENMRGRSSSGKTQCRATEENKEYDQWVAEKAGESEGWDTVYEGDHVEGDRQYRFHRTPPMDSALVSPRRSGGCSDGHRRSGDDWSRTPPGGWSSTSPPRRWHVRTSPPRPENVTSSLHQGHAKKKARGRSKSPYVANICFSNNTTASNASVEADMETFKMKSSRKVRKVKEKKFDEDDYKFFFI